MTTPKFKVGQLVRCVNPTHRGINPFVIDDIVPIPPVLYYGASIPDDREHDSGWVGCRESELELVKEAADGEAY